MSPVRPIVLTVRFLLELAMLAAFAYWGATVGEGVTAWLLPVAVPIAAAAVWGAFVAPKARWPIAVPVRLGIEAVLFGLAGLAVASTLGVALGVAFFVAATAVSAANARTWPDGAEW